MAAELAAAGDDAPDIVGELRLAARLTGDAGNAKCLTHALSR